jgi:methylated-DNA-protein-cysteine methyltransferase related protein
MNTFDKVFEAVSRIPRGKVTTYGIIAKQIGIKNPRVVGFALHVNKDPDNIPCHRVVNKDGRLAPGYAFGGIDVQKQLLEQEGVSVIANKVLLEKHLYSF